MTLAERMAGAMQTLGPMPECHLATEVGTRREIVSAELKRNPDRFVHNGRKARASRWDVRELPTAPDTSAALTWPNGFEEAEEALVTLVRTGREHPADAIARIVSAWAAM